MSRQRFIDQECTSTYLSTTQRLERFLRSTAPERNGETGPSSCYGRGASPLKPGRLRVDDRERRRRGRCARP